MKNNRLSRFAIPYVIWMALFVVAPIIMVVIYAFSASVGGFTLDNFAKMGTYTVVFTRSFKLALIATAICVLIGYPVSYKMSKEGPRFLDGDSGKQRPFESTVPEDRADCPLQQHLRNGHQLFPDDQYPRGRGAGHGV